MMGFFSSDPFHDAHLGTFERRGGRWHGRMTLGAHGKIDLILAGDRKAPSPAALALASGTAPATRTLLPQIERALLDHYGPYRDALLAGTPAAERADFPQIDSVNELWDHVTVRSAEIDPKQHAFDTEVAYAVTWDEEHTLGARIELGRFIELCGSI
jgi:hypothetical protein